MIHNILLETAIGSKHLSVLTTAESGASEIYSAPPPRLVNPSCVACFCLNVLFCDCFAWFLFCDVLWVFSSFAIISLKCYFILLLLCACLCSVSHPSSVVAQVLPDHTRLLFCECFECRKIIENTR